MKKVQVVDTNIFLSSPEALSELSKKHDVIIPFKVLEELDHNKKRQGLVGINARRFIRTLDELRRLGSLQKGVSLKGNKGRIFVELQTANRMMPQAMEEDSPDNQIVSAAMFVKQKFPEKKVIFITNDINLRVKCDVLGIQCEEYVELGKVSKASSLFEGFKTVKVTEEDIDKFYEGGDLFVKEEETYPNQFIMLQSEVDEKKTALARFLEKGKSLEKLAVSKKTSYYGLIPRNKEQLFALDLIMNPKISLVTLTGIAGTGKTLVALAGALKAVFEKDMYRKIHVLRPIVTVGKDIGYLPGSMTEKMEPFTAPIVDNLNFLLGSESELDEYLCQGMIKVEAMPYIRGRSIANSILIVDEAQNLSRHEAKTLITRVGEGTKIIFTGDLQQIDTIHLNEITNGLTRAVEEFKYHDIAGHVTMKKGERSALATLAARIMR